MQQAEARVAFIIRGVVQQALGDAGLEHAVVSGSQAEKELLRRWCDVAIADRSSNAALLLNTATKTELLLGRVEAAHVYPFGDLYASELLELGAAGELSTEVADMARRAGGIAALDHALRRLLDERRDAMDAFTAVPHLREEVMQRLERTRFHRKHIGVVPKIGARTLGIDLFI